MKSTRAIFMSFTAALALILSACTDASDTKLDQSISQSLSQDQDMNLNESPLIYIEPSTEAPVVTENDLLKRLVECSSVSQNMSECLEDEAEPKKLVETDSIPPLSSEITSEIYPYTVSEYVNYIVTDLDKQWTSWFLQSGLNEPYVFPKLIFPGDAPFTTTCLDQYGDILVVGQDDVNAFYCRSDVYVDNAGIEYQGSIVLPVIALQKMWSGDVLGSQSLVAGDFAAAIIIAHEFSHHIQDEIFVQYHNTGVYIGEPTGKNRELIADCFAGNWAATAYYSGLLDAGDFEEAAAALEAIARIPSDTHGTSSERVQALAYGYEGVGGYVAGDPTGCINHYWK